MFGFQPTPIGGFLYTTPAPLIPPPPPECNFDFYWYTDEYNYIIDLYAIPSSLFPTYIMLCDYNTAGRQIYADYTITGDLPNGLTFRDGIIYGSPGCNDIGIYELIVTATIPEYICPEKSITANLRIKTYCAGAFWLNDPITINGTAGNTINLDLADYVNDLNPYYTLCTQNYYFDPDVSNSSFSQNGNLISIKFDDAGYYSYSTATVSNSCQEFSAVSTQFIFNIT